MKRKKIYNTNIPKSEIDSLARRLFPAIAEFFESEEGKREFEEWKKQKESEKEKN